MPILIAGPTAAGKSTLALEIADRDGGVVVNADALQVFANWRILTARPTDADLALTPHHLYGHVPGDSPYSVGQWLRDITPLLTGPQRPIIVGGTGLYFMALTQGLADIPQTPEHIRTQGNQILAQQGAPALLADIDPVTLARIDAQNPMRVQRAWEVQQTTGRGLAAWQQDTPPPILPLKQAETLLLCADKDWLNTRISNRFDQMLCSGALQEAQDNLASWNPDHPSAKAIGARELISHVAGDMSLDQARDSATTATRQYAKRQRSWFRAKMADWTPINLP
ncbi:MAG: tRNA (adenosine(37)-N6)-dimethylallyltransferase MiaA [Paracoccaceae bacterium]